MISAAKKLKNITNQTMLDRIKQFNESGKKAVEFGVKDVFIDSIFTELVNDKTLELFKGEDYESALNGFVKGNEKIGELVGGVFGMAGGGVLVGDLLVGSTNNTNRIIEMYLLSDIYQCIFFEYMDKFSGAFTLDLDLIMGSMPYLDMMTYVILRGEYCNSKIYEDSGIIGFLSFEQKEKNQSNYNKQVNFVTNSNSQLARLYKDIIAYLEDLSKNLEPVFFSGYYDGEYLYEIVDRSIMEFYLIRTNTETFEQEEIFDFRAIGMFNFDYTRLDDYFYFMDDNGVHRVKIDGTGFQKIAEHGTIFGADMVWPQFLVTIKGIYYSGIEAPVNNGPFSYDPCYFNLSLDGSTVSKITSTMNTRLLTLYDDKLYSVGLEGIYSMNLDGSSIKLVVEADTYGDRIISPSLSINESKIYFSCFDDNGDAVIKSANHDGTGVKTISNGLCSQLLVLEDKLYIFRLYSGEKNSSYDDTLEAFYTGNQDATKAFISIYDINEETIIDLPEYNYKEKEAIGIIENRILYRSAIGIVDNKPVQRPKEFTFVEIEN